LGWGFGSNGRAPSKRETEFKPSTSRVKTFYTILWMPHEGLIGQQKRLPRNGYENRRGVVKMFILFNTRNA
jgi:hypothetical protein